MTATNHWSQATLLMLTLALAQCAQSPLHKEIVTSFDSGEKIRSVTEYSLTRNAIATIEKHYDDAWSPRSIAPGKGTVIRIYESSFLIGSFDGLSHSEILIQLPDNPVHGKRYHLTAASGARATRMDKYKNILAYMKDGEVAAYQFNNPLDGQLKKVDLAWIEVLSVGSKTGDVHLRLKAKLDPTFDFDIDEEYAVGLAPNPKR